MNELVSHLLTLLLGALAGGLAKVAQDAYSRHQDTRSIAAALQAEISVLTDGIRRGNYIQMCDRIIVHVSQADHIVTADDYLEAPVAQAPCPVFNAHCTKIGLLGDSARAVVRTYQLYESVTLDLRFLPERHKRQPLTGTQLVEFHSAMKTTFEDILKTGNLAMNQLQEEQRIMWCRRWWRPREGQGVTQAP